jgi:Peptidase family M23
MRSSAVAQTTALVSLSLALSAGGLAAQSNALPPSVDLRVPKPPTVARADGKSFLVYELHLTNFGAQPVTLQRVEVAAGSGSSLRTLIAVTDSPLLRTISRPGLPGATPDRNRVSGGMRAVMFLWVPLGENATATALQNRVTVAVGNPDSARVQELEASPVPVNAAAAPVGPPLRGGVWLTGNGPAAETGHRRALIAVTGTATIAQRFAIDYVKVGEDNQTFSGDRLKNESYYAYGADALAVADGIVVATKDSIPQNIPGPSSRAVPITLETVGGNHVIIDIGGGRYAFYAHLQPGSLRVKVGDRVRRGQVVGLVGNSGNSTEPHLHFHLSDGVSPLGAEGIPYGVDAFELVGRCRAFNTGCESAGVTTRRNELPLGNLLVRFPQ